MSLEELCDKAIAAGNNCTVTVSTGPVVSDPFWLYWLIGGAVVIAVAVAIGITVNDVQEHRTKRYDAEVREIARSIRSDR